jgi:DNA-binding FadR family transcriptional regulator
MPTKTTGEPAGQQLAGDLRRRIVGGELAEGAQLPSSAALQAEHGVSSTVVRDALNTLKAEGLVVGQQGKGVFVAPASTWHPGGEPADDLPQRVADLEKRVAALEAGRSAS